MNADEALRLLYDDCDHYTEAVVEVREEVERLREIETAATELLTYWHDAPASHRDWVEIADERVRDLIDHLAAVVGGLT